MDNLKQVLKSLELDLKYNVISGKTIISLSEKSWDTPEEHILKFLMDETISPLIAARKLQEILRKIGLKFQAKDLVHLLEVIARDNTYNPLQDLLEYGKRLYKSLEDDEYDLIGEPGLTKAVKSNPRYFFNKFLSCIEIDTSDHESDENYKQFLQELIYKWLANAVIMANNKGEQSAQGILVLSGKQRIGKTSLMGFVVPEDKQELVRKSLQWQKKNDKDQLCLKYWISEFGEIDDYIKRENINAFKNFITQSIDVQRKMWSTTILEQPRKSIFYGTTNKREFLIDDTGESRFWVIPISKVDFEKLKEFQREHCIMMWGEVQHNLKQGNVVPYLTPAELLQLEKYNSKHKKQSSTELLILDWLDDLPESEWEEWTVTEVNKAIGKDTKELNMTGRTLTKLANAAGGYHGSKIRKRKTDKCNLYLLPKKHKKQAF